MAHFMTEQEEMDKHASAFVAPLNIQKSPKRSQSRGPGHRRQSSSRATTIRSQSQSQISPPLTPRTSTVAFPQQQELQTVFHNYQRAFYHFHPSSTVTSSGDESSITVPISRGDVILVHSVHPNGWADGTVLSSGERGWLPTNYCEPYEHPTIHALLNALTNLWDLVREGENGDLAPFTRQDYVRAMIAGVRFFLETTQCLRRESPLIQAHAGLRRMRKGMLAELSSMVKTAKKLQESLQANVAPMPEFEQLDELVLKSFKLVTRAVRFLDIWLEDAAEVSFDFTDANTNRPLTPPSDAAHPPVQPQLPASTETNHGAADDYANAVTQQDGSAPRENALQPPRNVNRISVAFSLPSESDPLQSPLLSLQPHTQAKRVSVSHRVSYTAKSQGARAEDLASERLSAAHDSFLSFIGSFIGGHLQSRSCEELRRTTEQSVISCQKLLAIVEEVWDRDSRRSDQLAQARDTMYARLTEVVQATKHIFNSAEMGEGDEILVSDSGSELVTAAINCVRAAGDCVAKTKITIERIGDFEFEHVDMALSDSIFDGISRLEDKPLPAILPEQPAETEKPLPAPPQADAHHLPPPLVIPSSKPLPEVPAPSPLENSVTLQPLQPSIVESPTAVSFRSSKSSLPPLTQLPTPQLCQPSPSDSSASPASGTHRFFGKTARADSVNASVADSNSVYRNSIRFESGSIVSQASTRATTPDQSPAKQHSSQTLMSSFGSASELRSMASEDVAAGEEHILYTTFAHELTYNKDGQISGGSLPALVEQLTTHDSTPDAMFVTAFYLTFRLFTTPVEFAQCLIDRFDYVGDNQTVGVPVRLRVYNVFKGWLESHWLEETDTAALHLIISFANEKLGSSLPSAGKRLAELTSRVTQTQGGALVPRLVSSIGKTGVSNTLTQTEGNAPNPLISKSQLNALRAANEGKATCSILDFDPMELARQCTLIESKIFCAIQPEELLASEWTKEKKSKSENVHAMACISNNLTSLVSESILKFEDQKKRASVIKHWIKIAMKNQELNNYHSLMAIMCALNSTGIGRLKKTWDCVSAKTKARFAELNEIIVNDRNFTGLRQRFQNHVAPCVPFLGLYLTDLTMLDTLGPTRPLPGDTTGTTVINFDKHMKTANIIGQLQSLQVPYRLTPIPEMQQWIESQLQRVEKEPCSPKDFHRRSCLLEPRELPRTVRVAPPQLPVDSSASSTFSADSRTNSKDRFDFLGFSFSTNSIKDR